MSAKNFIDTLMCKKLIDKEIKLYNTNLKC